MFSRKRHLAGVGYILKMAEKKHVQFGSPFGEKKLSSIHPFEMNSLGIFGRLDSLNPDGLTDWFMVGGCGVLFIVVFIGWVVST